MVGKHKGFAFVEFEEAADAQNAIENMHLSELNKRVIKVVNARGMRVNDYSDKPG